MFFAVPPLVIPAAQAPAELLLDELLAEELLFDELLAEDMEPDDELPDELVLDALCAADEEDEDEDFGGVLSDELLPALTLLPAPPPPIGFASLFSEEQPIQHEIAARHESTAIRRYEETTMAFPFLEASGLSHPRSR